MHVQAQFQLSKTIFHLIFKISFFLNFNQIYVQTACLISKYFKCNPWSFSIQRGCHVTSTLQKNRFQGLIVWHWIEFALEFDFDLIITNTFMNILLQWRVKRPMQQSTTTKRVDKYLQVIVFFSCLASSCDFWWRVWMDRS